MVNQLVIVWPKEVLIEEKMQARREEQQREVQMEVVGLDFQLLER